MRMKRFKINRSWFLFLALLISCAAISQDSIIRTPSLILRYFCSDNKVPYLFVQSKWKVGKKYEPAKGIVVKLYLDNDSGSNLLGKVTTNEDGDAKAIIPPTLKPVWDNSETHTFIGISEATKEFDETRIEAAITKTKITIDTLTDGETRSITVNVSALNGTDWVPAKDVEMKIGISRLGGILSAGDEDTYTTDSTGNAIVEFKKDSLPGDVKGNIVLVARVEDNDQYGNLQIEKTVPWGVSFTPDNTFFNQRTLWSTRFRTPAWLLFMAYSIVIGVWGTIVYLVLQIVKIKKLSKNTTT